MIGEVPFFVEANAQMPRTFGENQVHVSQVAGWCEADYPLVEVPPREATETDRKIAELVAERIPDGATIQAGIGSVPDQVLRLLSDHSELGVHTELFERRLRRPDRGAASITGTRKATHRNKAITTTRARHASGCSTSSPTTPGSSSGRSTTPTTRATSAASRR